MMIPKIITAKQLREDFKLYAEQAQKEDILIFRKNHSSSNVVLISEKRYNELTKNSNDKNN